MRHFAITPLTYFPLLLLNNTSSPPPPQKKLALLQAIRVDIALSFPVYCSKFLATIAVNFSLEILKCSLSHLNY